MPEPIVQFETNGKASILNYNVPNQRLIPEKVV